MAIKETPAVKLTADKQTLLRDNFTTDTKGNVLIKNAALNKALKDSIDKGVADPNIAAIKIGVVVDF